MTKKSAWKHWKQHGLKEGRSFSYLNNSNIHNSRFGNLFFINMFLNLISMKYNLKCSYKHVVQFGKLGIHFYKGTNEYDKHLLVTENNFMHILTNDLEPCNIIITNSVWFQSREFCKKLLELNRSFTRDDINTISTRVDRNVWTYRGGWYSNPDTGATTPWCRHEWMQQLVIKQK